MTEKHHRYIHPIDPEAIGLDFSDEGRIYASGHDQFQNRIFLFLRNAESKDLHEAQQQAQELKASISSVVVGPGMDLRQSRQRKKRIFNHQRLGLWAEVDQYKLLNT